ncbi:MAG: YicC family protein [Flavobacteriaceae bacterium]|nr:YicC family protein [Flavobacteriaceae bacterium]OUV85528.1 MAG: YicC family protein [Flavobacteriaceae bacterium TMED145]
MIKSMTGYASESFIINSTKFIVEIKSVNSKILDLNIRFPHFLKAYENGLRKEISNKLHRGKIELNVNSEIGVNTDEISINKEIISNYIQQLKELDEINSDEKDYLKMAMRLPNAYSSKSINLKKNEINNIIDKISIAVKNLNYYRAVEGSEMEKDFRNKISEIKKLLGNIEKIEKDRIAKKRTKLVDELKRIELDIDNNRLEQEMIYYLEKYDINEEIIRLKSNILIFENALHSNEPVGKKLGFICQEIGREINTIGSKANDSNLQKLVIEMKDSLEKIKENILNIL